MKDFEISKILSLLARTAPFLVFRFLVYFGITLAYVLATGAGAGVGYFIGRIGGNPGAFSVWGGIAGFGVTSAILYFMREYILYLVKAGHIAVLVELMQGKEIPGGRSQIDYAQQRVRERFVQSSVLFGVDQLIKGILRRFNRVFFSIASFIPLPGSQGVVKFANTVINNSLTFLDEVILAHNLRTEATNPWRSSQDALILYAQNYKAFLKNALFLTLAIWVLTFVVFLIALAPAAAIVAVFPGAAGILTLMIAVVFAWGMKQAIIEPFGMTALMQVFFTVTEGQEPNPEWDAKLSGVSRKFGELKSKAASWTPADAATDPASPEPPPLGEPGTPG